MGEDNQMEQSEGRNGFTEDRHSRTMADRPGFSANQKKRKKLYLGCLTKLHLIILSVAIGLSVIIIILTTALLFTKKDPHPLFSTGGDMLDFLVQTGDISEHDALLATWFHRANGKDEMNKALASDSMILEADVILEGNGTSSQNPVPIMAHPPETTSDNTLDQWLDSVLASRKGIKLDFKSLDSADISLDILQQKNSSKGINRPVWLNADILRGPNVPSFVPPVNGSRFLQLIQEKFPDVTLSPGWKVLYGPPIFTGTYTRAMVEDMLDLIKDCPQKVTFPVHALLVRSGWQHISWLLSQSPRYSLTLWQGSDHPTISDLLFVRDNSHPARVYYDIYEPTLSDFKQSAGIQNRLRRFYPGGDLMDFLCPAHGSNPDWMADDRRCSSLEVRWIKVTDQASMVARFSDMEGGMLVLRIVSDRNQPGVPVVEDPGMSLSLQFALTLLGQNALTPWGVYLQVETRQLLEASLKLLDKAYRKDELYRPVWISLQTSHSRNHTDDLVSTVEELFPYVTLVLPEAKQPAVAPAVVRGLSQRVALHLNAAQQLQALRDRVDLILDSNTSAEALEAAKAQLKANTHLFLMNSQP